MLIDRDTEKYVMNVINMAIS